MNQLYNKRYRDVMQVADDYSDMGSNRIDEIRNFARGANFTRIGIAHCIMFSSEARIIKEYFSKYFEVYTVDCKYGRVPSKDILGGEGRSIICNPAGQADFLNQKKTELNISMGLCVGHDMVFSKTSEGLVTNLFDKDFTNNNNPGMAINDIQRKLN